MSEYLLWPRRSLWFYQKNTLLALYHNSPFGHREPCPRNMIVQMNHAFCCWSYIIRFHGIKHKTFNNLRQKLKIRGLKATLPRVQCPQCSEQTPFLRYKTEVWLCLSQNNRKVKISCCSWWSNFDSHSNSQNGLKFVKLQKKYEVPPIFSFRNSERFAKKIHV